MSRLTVTQRDLDMPLITSVRNQLDVDDPYLSVIDDHASLVETNHHPTTLAVASDGETKGYAVINEVLAPKPATLDIVTAKFDDEIEATRALIETVKASTPSFIWWTREPRNDFAEALGNSLGGNTDRVVVHMQRPLDDSLQEQIATRSFSINDLDEVVRINNEAFVDHPDRSNISAAVVKHDLEVQGNKFDYIRMIDGAFCWLKQRSPTEIECFVLAVDNAHQGQHLGPKLLESGMHFARAQGASLTSLYVEHNNMRALALYEHLGFSRTSNGLRSIRFSN